VAGAPAVPRAWITDLPLTDEQHAILSAALVDRVRRLVIRARAGTGKTSTLRILARNTRQRLLYLVFNASNAADARRTMPSHVKAMTIHALAFHALRVPERFGPKLNARRRSRQDRYRRLGIDVAALGEREAARWLIGIDRTVRHYCHSADAELTTAQVTADPHWFLTDEELKILLACQRPDPPPVIRQQAQAIRAVRRQRVQAWAEYVIDYARAGWRQAIDPADVTVPMVPDHYLKLWQLSTPVLSGFPLIVVDEMQDSNPVTLDLLQRQDAQLIGVGDSEQAIYGWRGAVDALDRLSADRRLSLTQSFRFGPAIAEIANQILAFKSRRLGRALDPVVGNPRRLSRIGAVDDGAPYAYLCRGNAALFEAAVAALDPGCRLHLVGDLQETVSLIESAWALKRGQRRQVVHPDIRLFSCWDELRHVAEDDHHLGLVARLIEKYGDEILPLAARLSRFRSCPRETADVVAVTVHRSKGLEFSQVKLAEDFIIPVLEGPLNPEELNLLYVAVTRALDRLQINSAVQAVQAALAAPVSHADSAAPAASHGRMP